MAIIILPICFISIFLSLVILYGTTTGKREILLGSALTFCGLLVLITEVLSLFHSLNYTSILFSWVLIAIANTIYHYFERHKLFAFYKQLRGQLTKLWGRLNWFEMILLASVLVMLLLIFIQGIIYPPTNWDSMTYHLARIPNWISEQSVQHFPTAITRQLYQPPFAEYVMLHFNMLSRGDYFSASVQFLFLLLSLTAISCIVKSLGLNLKYQIAAAILAATIPEVVLQASSTQNDIVVSFFIITGFYFAIRAINTLNLKYYLFFGLSLGLGLLTKGTAYIYLAPVILIFGIVTIARLLETRKPAYLTSALVVVIIAISINSGHYYRNYKLSGNVLGVDKTEGGLYTNEKMNPPLLISNIIKNAGLHVGVMFAKPVAVVADSVIYKIHRAAGIDINNPATNYRSMKYGLSAIVTNEDEAPNPFHLLLIVFSIIVLFFCWKQWKDNPPAYWLLIAIILQIVFFCLYLKWQPWNSRLHVPVFLLVIPLICYAGKLIPFAKKASYVLLPLLIVYALITVLHNDSRPINAGMFSGNRYQKYFVNKPAAYPEYAKVTEAINHSNFKNVGLIFGVDDWEYPLFTNCYSTELNPVHIQVNNISNQIETTDNVDCILSTTINKPFIDYHNHRYYNQDGGNKVIYLYR